MLNEKTAKKSDNNDLRIIFTSLLDAVKRMKNRIIFAFLEKEGKRRTIKSNILYKFTVQMQAHRIHKFEFSRDLLWIKDFK